MELDSAGKFGIKAGEGKVNLEVFACDFEGKSYYVAKVKRECFDRVAGVLGDDPLVDSTRFSDRERFFPDNTEAFTSRSPVVIRSVEDGGDGQVLDSRVVEFGRRAYWRTKAKDVVREVSTLLKGVFAKNPDVDEVLVMVDADGEYIVNQFKGMVPDEEKTGEF